ncbi:hypothetical protein [Flagellimonas algicola]|nr:hypothetical protein [Allomuricauda algicola]
MQVYRGPDNQGAQGERTGEAQAQAVARRYGFECADAQGGTV